MAEHNGAARHGAVDESDRAHDHREDDSAWDDGVHGDGHRPVRYPVDSQVVADPGGTRLMSEGHTAFPRPRKPRRHPLRWIVIGAIVAAILGAGFYWGLPWARYELETVSTDDAFVSSHINIPIGIVSSILTSIIVQDPPGMDEEVRKNWKRGLQIDYIGLGLVPIGLGSLEVIYAKGQEWDWFGDPFWRAQTFFAAAVIGLVAFAIWELRHPNPMVNLRLLERRTVGWRTI
jgi:hypothetical protein